MKSLNGLLKHERFSRCIRGKGILITKTTTKKKSCPSCSRKFNTTGN